MSHRRTSAVWLLLLLLAIQDADGKKFTRAKTKFSKPKINSVASSVKTKLKTIPVKITTNLKGSSSSEFSRNGTSALDFIKEVIVDSVVAVSKDMTTSKIGNVSETPAAVFGATTAGSNILFQWSSHSVLLTLLMAYCQH